jgi:hypothetical protein
VGALPPLHASAARCAAIGAAAVEVAEAQPMVGELLRLVAELYAHAALGGPPAPAAGAAGAAATAEPGAASHRSLPAGQGPVRRASHAGAAACAQAAAGQVDPSAGPGPQSSRLQQGGSPSAAQLGAPSHGARGVKVHWVDDVEAAARWGQRTSRSRPASAAAALGAGSSRGAAQTRGTAACGPDGGPLVAVEAESDSPSGAEAAALSEAARHFIGISISRRGSTRGTTRTLSSSGSDPGDPGEDGSASEPEEPEGAGWDHGSSSDDGGGGGADGGGCGAAGVAGSGGGGGLLLPPWRRSLVSDRFRGSSFGGGPKRRSLDCIVPAQPPALAGGAGVGGSCGGPVPASPSARCLDSGSGDAGSSAPTSASSSGAASTCCTPQASQAACGAGNARSGGGPQRRRRASFERYSWGATLVPDPWVPTPRGVARLDLSDLEARIHEQRQKRLAAAAAARAKVRAGGK